jgi:hypothetical protein
MLMPAPAKPRRKAASRLSGAKPTAKSPKSTRPVPAKPRSPANRKPAAQKGTSKQSRLIAALQSASGATIEQMTKLTGWQAHTVRGVISGTLRKRLGLDVKSASEGEGATRTYRIIQA